MADDAVWLDVLPSMGQFGRDLARKAVPAARSAGKSAGREYSKEFEKGSGNAAQAKVKELEAAQKSAAGLVSKLSGEVSKARQAQQRSAASVISAEQRVTDAVEKYGEESSQAEAATLRLEAAKGAAADASGRFERSENALREAQKASKTTAEQLEKAQADLGDEVRDQPGLWGKLKGALEGTEEQADKTSQRIEKLKDAGRKVGKGLAIGAGIIAGAVATLGGIAIKGGLDRALNIEDARASLTGLGNDAQTVDGIMENALASVKGTSFGLGDAATIASTAVAAGIKPGQDLQRTLTLTANAAAVARTGLDEMGSILNKVWTKGRVSTEELNQIGDRGIPIWTKLAERYQVSGAELEKMVSKGKVDAETFADVLENTVGNAAEAMGDTTRGSWANMMAALSRGGESFLSGIFPMFKDGLQGITGLLDDIGPVAEEMGKKVGDWIGDNVVPVLQSFGAWVKDTGVPALQSFAGWISDNVVPAVQSLFGILFSGDYDGGLGKVFGIEEDHPLIGFLFTVRESVEGLFGFIKDTGIPALQETGKWVLDNKDWLSALAVSVGTVVAVWKTWQGVQMAWMIATKAGTAIQTAFNAVMNANPIMLIVTAVAALVAGLVYFFTQTETGQKIWEGFTDAIGTAITWVKDIAVGAWEKIKAGWDGLVGGVKTGYDSSVKPVLDAFGAAATWLWQNMIQPVWNGIKAGFDTVAGGIKSVWDGVLWPVINVIGTIVWALWDTYFRVVWFLIQVGWNTLVNGLKAAWDSVLKPTLDGIGKAAKWLWEKAIKPAWDGIKAGWDFLVRGVKTAWATTLKPALDAVGSAAKWLWEKAIKPAWDNIKAGWDTLVGGIKSVWNDGLKPVFDKFGKIIKEDVPGAFTAGKDAIKGIWDKIKAIAAAPINFVINTVYNDGLRKAINKVRGIVGGSELPRLKGIPGYAKGGQMGPGWKLVGEEGPELIHTGPGYVYTADETKKMLTGREQAPTAALDVLDGATMADAALPVGGLLESIKSGVGSVASAVGDAWKSGVSWVRGGLAKAAELILSPIRKGLSSALPDSGIGDIAKRVVESAIDKAISWIRGKDEEVVDGESLAPFEGTRGGFRRPARGPITSRYGARWGAFHAGVDIGGSGPTYAAWGGRVQKVGWNALSGRTGIGIVLNHGNGLWTYSGHNPVGGVVVSPGQEVKAGQRIGRQGSTGNSTGDHLHWEVHKGRLGSTVNPIGYLYDQGGVLAPGVTTVVNKTRQPEIVYTNAQSQALTALAERGAQTASGPLSLDQRTIDALVEGIGQLVVEAGDDAARRGLAGTAAAARRGAGRNRSF